MSGVRMTNEQMQAELDKLNKAQRSSLRAVIPGTLTAVSVMQVGWTTRVYCESNGFQYLAKLGPRGRKLAAIIPLEIH